jgi:mannonate dehydratase
MKLGLGLYHHMLTKENFKFAKQMGANYIVAHLTDYRYPDIDIKLHDYMYSYDNLLKLKEEMAAEGVEFHAIENFCPAHWHDILLDGPKREKQIDFIKTLIQNVGRVGIPIFGYNFSIAGVWGLTQKKVARGGAKTAVFHNPEQTPIPKGTVWNKIYDKQAPEGFIEPITHEQLWDRLTRFLKEIIPIAEEAGVIMAAHPDDPPMPTIRHSARLVYQPSLYQKLLDAVPSPNNKLEFCMGTIQEMTEGNIYEAIEQYCDHIGYVHFRNVKGKVPHYDEVFVDEGDIDMLKALEIYKRHNFKGIFIPDHTPQTECQEPWHAGMAFALGYMKAAMDILNKA